MKDNFNDWSTGAEILDISKPVNAQLEFAMMHAYSLGLRDGKKKEFVDSHESNVIEEVADERTTDDVS